jgi:adenosylmethionine-8-amino-7-oxononanoate aminotransferase
VKPDIIAFAKGVTSGYLPLGGIMVTKPIKDAMDTVKPADRWMHASTYSAHPTCCAVALVNLDIMERERLSENAAKMGKHLHDGLINAFSSHPNVGDIRGGKGLLAAVEFVEDRETKKNFDASRQVALKLRVEMMKRGVVTRTRPSSGEHPLPGDVLFFAPPLVVTESEIDRFVSAARETVSTVLGN